MTASNRAEALMEAMERLAILFAQENDAIRARNLPQMNDIATRKPLLVRAYEDCVRSIKFDPEALQALDAEGRGRLKAASDAFIESTLTHARLVRAATQVTQSTVNTMVNAINRARADDGLYTRRGGTVMPAAYARRTTPSMSLDQRL